MSLFRALSRSVRPAVERVGAAPTAAYHKNVSSLSVVQCGVT